MRLQDFLKEACKGRRLTESQLRNVESLLSLGAAFHKDAGIPHDFLAESVSTGHIILEAGHQPNFLPHSGTWRKVFLLSSIAKDMRASGLKVVPVFGFADYNISTAPILYQNHLPDITKMGYKKIGFDVPKTLRWKRFDQQPKPTEEELESELSKIASHYEAMFKHLKQPFGESKSVISQISEMMRDTHKRAKNFADFNSFLFARASVGLLGVKVLFFRHSDIQKSGLFLRESKRLVGSIDRFNEECIRSLDRRSLKDEIGSVEPDNFPLWYHCGCGGKTKVAVVKRDPLTCEGTCPVCATTHKLVLDEAGWRLHYPNMAPTAVARNMIFAEGLGDNVYLSGAGGGLKYGQVANDVSKSLGFNKPITLAWTGRERYPSPAHKIAVSNLSKAIERTPELLIGSDVRAIVAEERCRLESELERLRSTGDMGDEDLKRQVWQVNSRLMNIYPQMEIAKKALESKTSFLEPLCLYGSERIRSVWSSSISGGAVALGSDFAILESDIEYDAGPVQISQTQMTADQFYGICDSIKNFDVSK